MSQEEKLRVAVLRAGEILVDLGLGDWMVTLNGRRTALAYTAYQRKEISFSEHFLLASEEETLVGVTRHEAAHALVGPGHGHGPVFQRKCIELGMHSEQARPHTYVGIAKYSMTCPVCARIWERNRRGRLFCPYCSDGIDIVPLKAIENPTKVVAW